MVATISQIAPQNGRMGIIISKMKPCNLKGTLKSLRTSTHPILPTGRRHEALAFEILEMNFVLLSEVALFACCPCGDVFSVLCSLFFVNGELDLCACEREVPLFFYV